MSVDNNAQLSAITSGPVQFRSDSFLKSIDDRHGFLLHEEFPSGLMPGTLGWAQAGTGIEATNQASNTDELASGIVYVGANNATEWRASYLNFNTHPVSRGITHAEFYTRLLTKSTSTEESVVMWGLIGDAGNTTTGLPTNGFGIKYDRATYGDFYSLFSVQGDTSTETATTIAVTAGANTFRRLSMIVDPQNDLARFFIDGVETESLITNLPKTDSQKSSIGWTVQKTADSAAVNQVAYVDYIKHGFIYNTIKS